MKRMVLFSIILISSFLLLASCGSKKDVTLQETRSPEELIQDGDLLFAQGNYEKALETYQRLLIYYPTSDLDIETKLRIAQCYNKMEKYEKQMDTLLEILRENLVPEKVPYIYIQIARYYEEAARFNPSGNDTADYETAMKYYKKAIAYKDSKDEKAKSEAKYRMALLEAKLGQVNLATQHYQEIVNEYPDSPFAILAQYKLLNPADYSELSTIPDSLEAYKMRLNLPAEGEETPLQEETETAPSFDEYLKNPQTTTAPDTAVEESTPVYPEMPDTTAPVYPEMPDTSTTTEPDTLNQ